MVVAFTSNIKELKEPGRYQDINGRELSDGYGIYITVPLRLRVDCFNAPFLNCEQEYILVYQCNCLFLSNYTDILFFFFVNGF